MRKVFIRVLSLILPMLLSVCCIGCKERIAYSLESYKSEKITEGEFRRSVEMIALDTSSRHKDAINDMLNDKFELMLEEYLGGEMNEREHLLIDSCYYEKDDVLCLATIAKQPSLSISPLVTSCVYLDLNRDVLYTTDEYLQKLGIDKGSLLETLTERIADYYGYGEYEVDIENSFYSAGELFLVLQITDPDGVRAAFTAFYNYDKKSFHFYRDSSFMGFEYLEKYIEHSIKEDDISDPADESTYIIEGERVIFTQYEGYESPIGWETFLQAYECGDLGDIKISELTVGDAVLSVDVKPSEKSSEKYAVYITSVTAFEHTYTFDTPLKLLAPSAKAFWGGKYFRCFVFFCGDHGMGETVVLASNGVSHFNTAIEGDQDSFEHSDDIITELFLRNDGEIGYTKTFRKYSRSDVERKAGILRYCLGKDEFCREQGRITNLNDGELCFLVEKTESVGDVHDIEDYFRELHAAWRHDFAEMGLAEVETVEELIEYNRAHYMRGGDVAKAIEEDPAMLLDISYGELKNSGFKLGYRARSVFSLYNCHGILLRYPSDLWSNGDISDDAVPCSIIITNDISTPFGLRVGMTGADTNSLIPEWDDVIYDAMANIYYTSCKQDEITLFAGWRFDGVESLGKNFQDIVKNEPVGVLCEIVLSASSKRLLPNGVRIEDETVYFDSSPASFDESFFSVVDLIVSGKLTDVSIKRFAIGNGTLEVLIEPYGVEEFFSVDYGIRSPSVSAYGQSVTFEEPMSLYGNLSARAFDIDGHFFFTNYYYSFGTTYILSRDGIYKQFCNVDADPYVGDPNMMNKTEDGIPFYNVPVITFYLDKEGELRYSRRAAKYTGWHTVDAPLAFSVGGDELYLESGSVRFEGAEPVLIPEEQISFAEQFGRESLEEIFAAWSENKDTHFLEEARQASTLDELWEINAKNFERFY